MRTAPKVVLGIGGVLLVIGIAVTMLGGASIDNANPDSEDWSGTLMWEGTTPTTYEGNFDWTHTYNVWVEEGESVQVEVLDGDEYNRFISCEELEDCWVFDEDGAIAGYDYIGEIWIEDSGKFEVTFTAEHGGSVDVMIRDDSFFGGFLGMMGGFGACCFGILFLILGGILAVTMKDEPKVQMSTITPIDSDGSVVIQNPVAAESVESTSADDNSPPNDGDWWEKEN